MDIRICVGCGNRLSEARPLTALFCSAKCRRENEKRKWRKANPHRSLCSPASAGAASELAVCSDLLAKGYHVFRAVSPSCCCDIAIVVGAKMLRVEVKTACRSAIKPENLTFPKPKNEFDLLALVVLGDRHIEYRPPLDTLGTTATVGQIDVVGAAP